jgi:hypothetical protein
MQHLTLEALARLVDEPPAPDESAHLRDCLVCRREMDAMRAQTACLAALADPEPRPGAWRALEAALTAEGLVKPERARRYTVSHPLLRIAAGLLLFAMGAGAGMVILRPGSPEHVAQTPAAPSMGTGRVLGIARLPPARADSTPVADGAEAEPAPMAAHLVSSAGGSVRPQAPRRRPPPLTARARAAARELDEAEKAYVAALRHYAEIADPASGADPETRLAALETLVETTGRALERAPGDPVLNGYHLAVLDERDALRRQIDRASESAWY